MENLNIYTNNYQSLIIEESAKTNEAKWLVNHRLQALEKLDTLDKPKIERVDYSTWPLWEVSFDFGEKKTEKNKSLVSNFQNTGVEVIDFKEMNTEKDHDFKKIYEKFIASKETDFFTAFTTAFLTEGLFIYVPKNLEVEEIIELSFLQNNAVHTNRHVLIYAEKNSKIEIVEKYQNIAGKTEGNMNILVHVMAEDNAIVQYSALDQLDKFTNAYIKRTGTTGKDAIINWAIGALNDGNVIEDVHVELNGKGSTSDVKIVAISHQQQTQGINVKITNNAWHTIGNIFQHGVVLDQATLTFNGIGHILNAAKNSDAQQESRVLMLSDEARADANPILLIDENEVEAGHAASISRVDQENLYYLTSRGLRKKQAEKLIIRGFLGIVLSEISIKKVREELIEMIERKLKDYGN